MADKYLKSRVVVIGSGTFPLDMLRYDNCVPATQEDVAALDSTFNPRMVRLDMFMPVGDRGGPTVDRWRSFGWIVLGDEQASIVATASDKHTQIRAMLEDLRKIR